MVLLSISQAQETHKKVCKHAVKDYLNTRTYRTHDRVMPERLNVSLCVPAAFGTTGLQTRILSCVFVSREHFASYLVFCSTEGRDAKYQLSGGSPETLQANKSALLRLFAGLNIPDAVTSCFPQASIKLQLQDIVKMFVILA